MRNVRLTAWTVALALGACQAAPSATTQAPQPNIAAEAPTPPAGLISGLPTVPLTIESHGKKHAFTVEVAATPAAQEQGLMYRQFLAPDAGMIFPTEPKVATFWMKNTYIPLDLIFIRQNGTIARIAANAVPMTLDVVSSNEPVTAVLEIAGGRAKELGLSAGDKVNWKR